MLTADERILRLIYQLNISFFKFKAGYKYWNVQFLGKLFSQQEEIINSFIFTFQDIRRIEEKKCPSQ